MLLGDLEEPNLNVKEMSMTKIISEANVKKVLAFFLAFIEYATMHTEGALDIFSFATAVR